MRLVKIQGSFCPSRLPLIFSKLPAPPSSTVLNWVSWKKKTFFLTEPVKKTFLGVKIGGVKRLLLKKINQRQTITQHVCDSAAQSKLTSYADTMEQAQMNWKSPPDRKYCNAILEAISCSSYEQTIDSGKPCMKSAVVVSRNERIPTDSFFECAVSLGLLETGVSKEEKILFWEAQRDLAFELYGSK
jgi:hypothetical protein